MERGAVIARVYFRPLIPLLVSMIVGIGAGERVPGQSGAAWVMAAAGVAALLTAYRRRKPCRLSPLVIFAALGYLSIQPWVSPRFPSHHIVRFTDGPSLTITGTVERTERTEANRRLIVLKTETLATDARTRRTAGNIRLTLTGDGPFPVSDDRIVFRSKIRPFRNFNNPGAFDYKRHMAFQNIWGAAYVAASRVTVVERKPAAGFRRHVEALRGKISRFVDTRSTETVAAVIKALVVGDRTGLPPSLRAAFHRAGVAHVLAISGLHVGIIATVSFSLFRRLLVHVTPLLWCAWSRKGAALLSLMPVWAYGLLAGMSPSTQRAVIMVSVFLLAVLMEREQDPINTVVAAALLILVFEPPSLFSISFQLSFCAVLFVLLGLRLTRKRPEHGTHAELHRFRKKILSFVIASVAAVLGTLPLVMGYFNEVSLVGLIGNLVVIPLIGFVAVPMGLLAVWVMLLNLQAASFFLTIASFGVSLSLGLIEYLSGLAFASVKTITPSLFQTAGYYALAAAMWFWVREKHRHARWVSAAVVAVLLAHSGYALHQRFWHTDLRVTAIDVGRGSAALIELPGGGTILVDGGGFSDNTVFDVGARVLAPFLWKKGIRTIDLLVLSHPNSDHLNGLLYIVEHFHVACIWANSEAGPSRGYEVFRKTVEARGIRMPEFKHLPRSHRFGDVHIRLLHPPPDFLERKRTETWRTVNNNSLVVHIRFGTQSFLFPGDVMGPAEAELVRTEGDGLKSTVLFSPHHGSRFSSTAEFLRKAAPEVAIVSAGRRSRHPVLHPEVAKRYQTLGCRLFTTAEHGAVTVSTDGRTLTVAPWIEGPPSPEDGPPEPVSSSGGSPAWRCCR